MNTSWRDKAKKKFKKPAENFFDFADEETTFNEAVQPSPSERMVDDKIEVSVKAPLQITDDIIIKQHLVVKACPTPRPPEPGLNAEVTAVTATASLESADSKKSNQRTLDVEPNLKRARVKSHPASPVHFLLESGDKVETPLCGVSTLEVKTEDKVGTQLGTEVETKWGQTEDKVETLICDVSTLEVKTEDKVGTQLGTEVETKWGQTEDKVETKASFSELAGLQRKIIVFLYRSCKIARASMTPPISIENLAAGCETSINSAKKTIQRLEKKGFIARPQFKDGRGGWTKYELSKQTFHEILQVESEDKLETKWGQTRDKVGTQPGTQLETTSPSKLVSDLNNNLLTSTPNTVVDDSSNIELDAVLKFGITRKHLQDIRNQKLNLSTLDLQDLITRFGIYASDPSNIRGVRNLPALFMKMAQQLAAGENMLEGIETPEDQALAKILKNRAAQKVRKQETEEALLTFEFEAWLESVPFEKRNELVPESAVVRSGSHAQTVMLKKYYVDNFWDDRRKKLLRQFSPMASVDTDL